MTDTVARVFPRRTKATPSDALAFVGDPPMFVPAISRTFGACWSPLAAGFRRPSRRPSAASRMKPACRRATRFAGTARPPGRKRPGSRSPPMPERAGPFGGKNNG